MLFTSQEPLRINLKSDPKEALILREIFPSISPLYHTNKAHWNAFLFDYSVPFVEMKPMIDNSYTLVVSSLSKVDRIRLATVHISQTGEPMTFI